MVRKEADFLQPQMSQEPAAQTPQVASALGDSSGGAKGMWGGRNVETKQVNRTGLTVSVQLEGSDVCLGANSLNNALRWLDNMVSRLHAN